MLNDDLTRPYYTKFELTAEEYWNAIQEPLKHPSDSYQYWIDGQKFILKKVSANVSVTFFETNVSPIPIDALKTRMINELITLNSTLQSENIKLLNANKRLEKERNVFHQEMEKNLAEKNEFESHIFSKFAQILNAKKEKIMELQKKCEQNEGSSKRLKLSDEENSEEENAYDQDTDIEDVQEDQEMEPISDQNSINLQDILSL